MKGLANGIKVGLVVVLVSILGYAMFKSVSERASGAGGYTLWAHFRDASGLAGKSRVVIAGLTVGEIADMRLEGRFARVTVKVRRGTEVWSNGVIAKKSSSLLGEFYLEIDPGSNLAGPDGVKPHLLKDGDEITHVIESTGIAELTAQAQKVLPHIDELVIEVKGLAKDTRELINGRVANMAKNLDEGIAQDQELVHRILINADRISGDIQSATNGSGPQVKRILANVEDASRELEDLIKTTKGEITLTGDEVRQKLDNLDKALAGLEDATSHGGNIAKKIDEGQGTLGRLVNDPTIADNIEGITEDAHDFTQSLFGLQTIVGLRVEYNVLSQMTRNFLSVEIYPKPDKFYLLELVADFRGREEVNFYPDRAGDLVRTETFHQGFRFTAEYGKKFDWLTLRIGIKESSGSAGADLTFFGGRGTVSLDAFDFLFDAQMRLRVTAAYRFYRYLYIVAGIDDALNDPQDIPIIGDNLTGSEPTEYHIGRDIFIGAQLRFTDEDLKALLYLGGSALSGIAK